jgi:hypothetical protein
MVDKRNFLSCVLLPAAPRKSLGAMLMLPVFSYPASMSLSHRDCFQQEVRNL